ncbi:MAG: hypothetical protein OEV49_05470 [candidate division Zixibacteria bacterium]|nr:hypothetical protein [candidate division Zixibacteria bacterium]MDH3938146.1 hypothetical protein [candidate division Zixibacteria bacterium]MDH4033047.1 hypothetical protein [candidate division Zixibacteria bacterium]
MPTSEKQIAANRRNAKKSTGPKSVNGKAASSRNAIKHGLHATDIVLNSPHLNEDPEQYQQLLDSLIEELKPEGILQEHLVLKIANALWRYRRVINAEKSKINCQLDQAAEDIERGRQFGVFIDPDDLDDDTVERRNADILGSQSMPSESHRDTLQRYEMRLDRQLTRCYTLLFRLQDRQESKKKHNKPISNTPPEPVKPVSDTNNARSAKE